MGLFLYMVAGTVSICIRKLLYMYWHTLYYHIMYWHTYPLCIGIHTPYVLEYIPPMYWNTYPLCIGIHTPYVLEYIPPMCWNTYPLCIGIHTPYVLEYIPPYTLEYHICRNARIRMRNTCIRMLHTPNPAPDPSTTRHTQHNAKTPSDPQNYLKRCHPIYQWQSRTP